MTTAARPVGRAAELALLSPRRAALVLAWPGIVENLVRVGWQSALVVFVGRLGVEALAAYFASLQYVFLLFPVWYSLSIGTIALVGRRMGAGAPDEAAEFTRQSLILGTLLGLASGAIFVLFAEQLLLLLGTTPQVASVGRPYLQITGGANALATVAFIGSAALRAAGDARSPLVVAIAGAGVGVSLAAVLTPPFGLIGLGVAQLIANVVQLVAILGLLLRGRAGFRLAGAWRLVRSEARTLLGISLPASGEQAILSVGLLVMSVLVLRLGTAPFAAYSVLGQIESISFMPCFGFSIAASALVGQALGANDPTRAERTVVAAAQPAMLWSGGVGLLFLLVPEPIIGLFTTDPNVIAVGAPALRVAGLGQLGMAYNFVVAGSLRGAGDTAFTLKATAANWFLVRLPLTLLLGFALGLGVLGVWAAVVTDYYARAAILTWRFRSRVWASLKY